LYPVLSEQQHERAIRFVLLIAALINHDAELRGLAASVPAYVRVTVNSGPSSH
jgi:hypothetical protein